MGKFYSKEYAAPIIDVIEDFLEVRKVTLPDTKRLKEEAGDFDEDNEAILYGEDYDELINNISNAIANLVKEIRPDLEVNEDSFGTSEIKPLNEVSVHTSAGTLTAYINEGSHNTQISIIHKTKEETPTDIFLAEVPKVEGKQKNQGKIQAYVYENPYQKDYTNHFTIDQKDILKAVEEYEEEEQTLE